MTVIGETLRKAREQKGLNIEEVAEATNLAKRYIVALEAEDFSVFHGDSYIIGFLRNYSEYLGLPADNLVASFKAIRLQEEPPPLNDLIPKRRSSPLIFIGIVVVILVVGTIVFINYRFSREAANLAKPTGPTDYKIDTANFEHRLYVGDGLIVTLGTEKYKVTLSKLDNAATVTTPIGDSRITLGEEVSLDVNKDGKPDIVVLLSDLAKKDPNKGAVIKVHYVDESAIAAAALGTPAEGQATDGAATTTDTNTTTEKVTNVNGDQVSSIMLTANKSSTIFDSTYSAYPFILSITVRSGVMIRYQIDNKDVVQEYYRKGDTFTLNINNFITFAASNARALSLVVQASGGKAANVTLGLPGEVVVKRFSWSRNDSGYSLVVANID